MDYNYHAHTVRCSHATGTAESYVQKAIENGIRYMGFSDHMPFVFPDGHESHYRVPFAESEEYIAEIAALREKYAGQIDLVIGFEMEYYPDYFEAMLNHAKTVGAEYLILGHHFLRQEYPDGLSVNRSNEKDEDLAEYVSSVIAAMETGVFTYVAHPDIFNFAGDPQLYESQMRRLCTRARELNVPLEINFLGIRRNRVYPADRFWEIAGQEKAPVTFGFDAHDTEEAYDGESLVIAKEMVRRFGLNYTGRPEIRHL